MLVFLWLSRKKFWSVYISTCIIDNIKNVQKQDVIKINLIQIHMNEVNFWIQQDRVWLSQPKAMTICWRVSLFIIWLYCYICYLQWKVHVKLLTSDIAPFLLLSVLCGKNFTSTKSYLNASLCTLDKDCPSDFCTCCTKNITNPLWCLESGGISVLGSQTLPN